MAAGLEVGGEDDLEDLGVAVGQAVGGAGRAGRAALDRGGGVVGGAAEGFEGAGRGGRGQAEGGGGPLLVDGGAEGERGAGGG